MDSICSETVLETGETFLPDDPLELSYEGREHYLLEWTTECCTAKNVVSLEEGWRILNNYGIKVIHRYLETMNSMCDNEKQKPLGSKGFTSLYTISYKLGTALRVDLVDYSRVLYDRCKESVEEFVQKNIVEKLNKLLTGEDIEFLKEYSSGWDKHQLLAKYMKRIFANLDRSVVRTEELPTVTSCYMNCFYVQVVKEFNVRTRQCLLRCFSQDRNGTLDPAHRVIIKKVVQVSPVNYMCLLLC